MGTDLSKKARDNIHCCQRDGGLDLNLSDCDLKKLSNKIVRLKLLVKLDISKNYIQSLPPSLARLKDLEEFYAEENEIAEFPAQLLKLADLKTLKVTYNKLEKLPEPFSRLGKLEVLHIGYNSISKLPSDFSTSLSSTLRDFDYSANGISELPECLWELKELTALNVSDNNLTYVPDTILALSKLQSLSLCRNQLANVPPVLKDLTGIHTLKIAGNKFVTLPDEVSQLPDLQYLDASANQMLNLDSVDFRNLTNLVELHLARNLFKHFNSTIGHCQKLKVLDLSENQITELEHQVGWLEKSLRKLLLHDNNLRQVPGEISFLNPALSLNISGNPLLYPFDALLDRGPQAIQDGLRPYIKAYPPNCVASGEGLNASFAGKPTSFMIEGFDKRGQPRVNGGDKYTGHLIQLDPEEGKEATKVQIIFKDENDGTFSAYYNAQVSGNYLVHIYESDDPIKGGPWNCYIAPDATNPQFCTADGPGLYTGATGMASEFVVKARDRFGNQQDHGNELVQVMIQGGSQPRPIIQDNNDGSYAVQFTPGWAGMYMVHVMINNVSIPGSPVTVNVI